MLRKLIITVSLIVFFLSGGINSGQAQETIKIAAIFAKSGTASAANRHHFQAVRFSIDEINQQGGLLGRKIELYENSS